ncbi:TetR/AcrR family transcriptional regulator [Georgenia soli]|nr:TetR/AcrR family transcriptional regulator [Georgenia soli]
MRDDGGAADGTSARPLRRDAEENRGRIVRAARELFAAQGLGVGFNDIARHAGVGVGTVYRRFPDKATLVRDALQDEVARLLEVADEALGGAPAWDGLMLLVEHVADLLAANLGLRDVALGPGQLWSEFDEVADRVRHHFEELLRRAQAEGSARADVTPQDLTMVYFMVTELALHASETNSRAYRRYLTVFMDGLRATSSATPLPEPLDEADADQIAGRWTSSS